jgi:hypothetical protein
MLMALQQMQASFILRHVVLINESSLRLDVLSSVPPHSLYDIFSCLGGFEYLICSHYPRGSLSLRDFSFTKMWVLPSCICFVPLDGSFVLLMIGKFSYNLVSK